MPTSWPVVISPLVPQGAGGVTKKATIQFKEFGVQFDFLPLRPRRRTVRLMSRPRSAQIDFSLATTLVQGSSGARPEHPLGTETTVELDQGQTLAIAGLLRAHRSHDKPRPRPRRPADPGTFFSNTTS